MHLEAQLRDHVGDVRHGERGTREPRSGHGRPVGSLMGALMSKENERPMWQEGDLGSGLDLHVRSGGLVREPLGSRRWTHIHVGRWSSTRSMVLWLPAPRAEGMLHGSSPRRS
jgi:hypothetical protein